jgi:hypothetical protein
VTPDDFADIAALRSTFNTSAPPRDPAAGKPERDVPSAWDRILADYDDVSDAGDYDPQTDEENS